MSDNTTLNPGSGGDTMRDKDRAGVKTGIIGLDLGIGTGTEVLMAGAMPVTGVFWQATQPVSGTLTVNAGTNLNTSLLALESGGHLASVDAKLPSLGQALAAASVPIVLTAAQISTLTPLSTVGISGAVAVTGTFWQATQPISGTVTANAGTNLNTSTLALESGGHLASLDTKLPSQGQALAAASIPVVLTAAQLTTLTPLTTVAVTGTFWQATQPVSGTVTVNAGTNLNTSLLALESGGNLASINTKTPALGQALAAASVPVVLTAAQISTLTPLSTVTANAGTNLNTSLLALETGGNLAILAGAIYAQASTTSGQIGPLIQAACTTLAPVYSGDNNKTVPLSIDTSGNLRATTYQSGVWTVQIGNTPNTTPILATPHDPAATTGSITVIDSGTSSTTGQNGQVIITGTPTASSFISCTFNGHTSYSIQITGTWTGTLSFDRSIDGGTTWTPTSITLYGPAGAAGTTYSGTLTSVTANCLAHGSVGGDTQIRVRATGAMTGSATILIQPGFGTGLTASVQSGTNSVYAAMLSSTPLYAKISLSSSGAGTVVAAVSGKQIVILRWSLSSNGTVNVNWQSHTTTGTATGLHYLTQFASAGGAYCPVGIFATVAGEALDLNLSGSVAVGGELTYILV